MPIASCASQDLGLEAYFSQHCLSQAAESRRQQQAMLEWHLCPPEVPARERTTEAQGRARRKFTVALF